MKMDDIELDDVNSSKAEITNSTANDFNMIRSKPKAIDFVDLSDTADTESHINIEKDEIIGRNNHLFNRVQNRFFCKIGNTYAFWFNKNDEPRIVIGPHCKYIINLIYI